ncbi:hypothetical protein C1O61_00540 [Akkermansia muciniphila]|nr:hypothetical protein C1O61_00540 [Akkermansia muciniphila]
MVGNPSGEYAPGHAWLWEDHEKIREDIHEKIVSSFPSMVPAADKICCFAFRQRGKLLIY